MDCWYLLAAKESDRKERKSNRCCHLNLIMVDWLIGCCYHMPIAGL